MKHTGEIKIGVFAITGLILLLFGWAYLREFAIHKQVSFLVKFDDVVGLTKGSFVRINGLRVGRVDSLTLDTKENKVIVDARIQLPKVIIPKDSKIFIRTSGYVGDKYLDIALGMDSEYIMDGDVVIGEPAFDAFQSLEKVSQVLDELDPKLLGHSIQDATTNVASVAKSLKDAVPDKIELTNLISNAHDTVIKLNTAIEKAQSFAINETAQNNLNKVLSQASIVSNDLNQTLKNANNLANNKTVFEDVNNLLLRAGKIIEQLDEIRADPLIQNNLRETLDNANLAAKKLSFTSDEVSMALNQRFILPRLFFGKLLPAKRKSDKVRN